MKSDEVNLYFYDDLKEFWREMSRVRVSDTIHKINSKITGTCPSNQKEDLLNVASLHPYHQLHFIPDIMIKNYGILCAKEVLSLFDSRPRRELFGQLERDGYDVTDLEEVLSAMENMRDVFEHKKELQQPDFSKWQGEYISGWQEIELSSLNFRLSYLERNKCDENRLKLGLKSLRVLVGLMHNFGENSFSIESCNFTPTDRFLARLPDPQRKGETLERICKAIGVKQEIACDIKSDFNSYRDVLFDQSVSNRSWYNKDGLLRELERTYFIVAPLRDVVSDSEIKDMLKKRDEVLYKFSSITNSLDDELLFPLVREAVLDPPKDGLSVYVKSLERLRESGYCNVIDQLKSVARKEPGLALRTLPEVYGHGLDKILTKVEDGELLFEDLTSNLRDLKSMGIEPTEYLVSELSSSTDRQGTLTSWIKTIDSFGTGNFDFTNTLHRNLEYTRFRKVIEHEKLRKHIKNHFTFIDYLKIFEQNDFGCINPFSDRDRFEIDCVAYETMLLRDYILTVKEMADELGKEVVVVPNLSYGYLPVSPLVEEFLEAGIDTIIGVKIGSTESHSDKEVMNSRLFKGHRTGIVDKQPVMLIVDGTYNLVTNNNRNSTARYPDAHQGYLNQVIAMNDANGFVDEDYSPVGKTEDDLQRLRESSEFKRAVEVYKHVSIGHSQKNPYTFELWNTAEMELAIRGEREVIATVRPYNGNVKQPTMIFCNVGVLDEQIPEKIKERFEGQHKPAYFDDSGKIIAFDFGFDNFGVSYLNRLETEVKGAYDRLNCRQERATNIMPAPAIIGYAMRNLGITSVEESVA